MIDAEAGTRADVFDGRRTALATGSVWHLAALIGIVAFFLTGGLGHLVLAPFFVAIVPDYIPAPRLMVATSGVCELAGAAGMLWPCTRLPAGIGLLMLTVVVFPANLHMALYPREFPIFSPWLLYLRLPLQLLILAWVAFAMRCTHRPP